MVADMEPGTSDGHQDLIRFWEEIPSMQRQHPVLQDVKPAVRPPTRNHEETRIHAAIRQLMARSIRLEQKLDQWLWIQRVSVALVMVLTALWCFSLIVHYSGRFSKTTTATY